MNEPCCIESIIEAFQTHYGLVVGVARRYVPTPDLIYDVVQQVFIDFVEGAVKGNWNVQQDARPILYTMTKNRALLYWREKKKMSSDVVQEVWEKLMELTSRHQECLRDEADELERETFALRHCLTQLSDKSRRLVETHYFEKKTIEQIARTERIKANTLRQALCRIRTKLRQCIELALK